MNLTLEKKEKIIYVLKKEFKLKPFHNVNVKEIVEKSVIHSLIERTFREYWSKEEFLEKYSMHLNWTDKGVSYGNL